MGVDWLFAAASHAADVMGDLVRHHAAYSRILKRWSDRSDTHQLWPFHALHAGLRARQRAAGQRAAATIAKERAAKAPQRGACWEGAAWC